MGSASRKAALIALIAIIACGSFAGKSATAAKLNILHSFCQEGCSDGERAFRGLATDGSGNFFGVTYYGGKFGQGTVFELRHRRHNFRFHSLHSFSGKDGQNPYSSLVVDTQGNLYGVTLQGGGHRNPGVVFELSPGQGKAGHKWAERILHSFCSENSCKDGANPTTSLTYAGMASGALYDGVSPLFGTTESGGRNDAGTAFELTMNGDQWSETVIHNFCSRGGCLDGKFPESSLIPDQAGNLYGTTFVGGPNNQQVPGGAGVAFELLINNAWSETVLYNFCQAANCLDGVAPQGNLAIDAIGNLYGITSGGGVPSKACPSGCGVIFKLVPDGADSTISILHSFCSKTDCRDGSSIYEGVVLDSSGNLFGTTQFGGGNDIDQFHEGGGVVYELTGSSYKVLHRFCSLANCADGANPFTDLVLGRSGNLYGTTAYGGAYGQGAVFEIKPRNK